MLLLCLSILLRQLILTDSTCVAVAVVVVSYVVSLLVMLLVATVRAIVADGLVVRRGGNAATTVYT